MALEVFHSIVGAIHRQSLRKGARQLLLHVESIDLSTRDQKQKKRKETRGKIAGK